MTELWPRFEREVERFHDAHLARPRKLFDAFVAGGSGSGRRPGPRTLYWQTVAVFSFAALEAGLEDLVYAAHARRNGVEGQPVAKGVNAPTDRPRQLVEKRLQNPGPQSITEVLFQDFGLLLGALPAQARFEIRHKDWSLGGSGRGDPRPGPATWSTLRPYIDALSYIRNATAHGDAAKLSVNEPTAARGALWLKRQDGSWSVQQPHALTALRVVLSTFNLVAIELGAKLGVNVRAKVTPPDNVSYPAR